VAHPAGRAWGPRIVTRDSAGAYQIREAGAVALAFGVMAEGGGGGRAHQGSNATPLTQELWPWQYATTQRSAGGTSVCVGRGRGGSCKWSAPSTQNAGSAGGTHRAGRTAPAGRPRRPPPRTARRGSSCSTAGRQSSSARRRGGELGVAHHFLNLGEH
jgi:hypothetical protein